MKFTFSKAVLSAVLISTNSLQSMERYSPPSYSYDSSSSSDIKNIGIAAAVVGGIAAAGYGLYKLCDWLFSKTDEEIIHNGRNACAQLLQHKELYEFIQVECFTVGTLVEPHCYHLACSYRKKSMHSIMNAMQSAVQYGKDASKELSERMRAIQKKNPYQTLVLTEMETVKAELTDTIIFVEQACNFCKQHATYFALFECEDRLMRLYERELRIFEKNYHTSELRAEVRIAAMKLSSQERTTYPHMQYAQRLDGSIHELQQASNALAYNYANRIQAARVLLHRLQTIHECVISEDVYHYELREYEKARLEQLRIEAQQRQACALEDQARQMREQAWQLQRQNELREQEIRLERERNQLLWQQTVQQSMPQYHVHVVAEN